MSHECTFILEVVDTMLHDESELCEKMMNINVIAKLAFSLSIIGALAGCSGGSSTSHDSEEGLASFSDGTAQLSAQERWRNRLVTTDSSKSIDGRWFCSFYSQEQYLSRSTLTLRVDDTGLLDAMTLSWKASEVGALELTSSEWVINISSIVFSNRNTIDDHFEGLVSSDVSIQCDWSGSPRQDLPLLSDELEPEYLFDDEELDPDIEGRLLTTLNGGTVVASWACEMSRDAVVFDYSEYQFFVGNAGFSVFDFRWFPTGDDSVRIIYGDIDYELQNIRFENNQYIRFFAFDTRGFEITCDWTGDGRS